MKTEQNSYQETEVLRNEIYEKPSMEIIEMEMESCILQSSGYKDGGGV